MGGYLIPILPLIYSIIIISINIIMRDLIQTSIILLIIDTLYLGLIAADPFKRMVKKIQNSAVKINFLYAASCYVLLMAAFNYFIIKKKGSYLDAFLLGFFIYGVFDFTNLALFNKYDFAIGIQDTIWGGLLFVSTLFVHKNLSVYLP